MIQPQQAVVSTGVIPGQPMQTQYPPYRTHFRNPNFASQQALFIGISQIVIGVLCIVFNIAARGINEIISVAAHGIWGGILFIVTGSLGVGAARTNSKCLIVSFNVIGIILASLCLSIFALGVGGAANSFSYLDYLYTTTRTQQYSNGYNYYFYGCSNYNANVNSYTSCIQGQIAMESLLAILAVIGSALTIWGCVLACRAHCCCRCCRVGAPDQSPLVSTGAPMQVMIQQQQQQNYPLPPQNYATPQNRNPQGHYPGYAVAEAGLAVQQQRETSTGAPPYTASASSNTNIPYQPKNDMGFQNDAYDNFRK